VIPQKKSVLIAGAVIGIFVTLLSTRGALRAEEKPGDEAPAGQHGEKKEERRKDVKMPFVTAAIQGGIIYFSGIQLSAKNENGNTQTFDVSNRLGLILKVHLNVLGSGLAIELNPFFAEEWVGDNEIEKFAAVGLQLGLAYRFHFGRFYPKVGIGAHLAYLDGKDIGRGVEAFGRLPVGFTVYFMRFLAFDMEAAFLTGATGLKTNSGLFSNHMRFDYTSGAEIVIGLRFP
jgi:predicted permease